MIIAIFKRGFTAMNQLIAMRYRLLLLLAVLSFWLTPTPAFALTQQEFV